MTRRHRQRMTPHWFRPDGSVRALTEALVPCESCGMYRSHAIHRDVEDPETDDSRILGEHDDAA